MSRNRRPSRRVPSRRPQRRKVQRKRENSGAVILSAGIICLVCFFASFVANTLWAGMARERVGDDLAVLTNASREVRGDLTRQVARNAQFVVLGQRMEETVDKGDELADDNVQYSENQPEPDAVAEATDVTED